MTKVNSAPEDIQDTQLEELICQTLSLSATLVSPSDLEACHRVMRKDRVIIKFSSRKRGNDVIFKKKSLNGKPNDLKNLGFSSGNLFISDSMCYENYL